jgi:hypothetical protein
LRLVVHTVLSGNRGDNPPGSSERTRFPDARLNRPLMRVREANTGEPSILDLALQIPRQPSCCSAYCGVFSWRSPSDRVCVRHGLADRCIHGHALFLCRVPPKILSENSASRMPAGTCELAQATVPLIHPEGAAQIRRSTVLIGQDNGARGKRRTKRPQEREGKAPCGAVVAVSTSSIRQNPKIKVNKAPEVLQV